MKKKSPFEFIEIVWILRNSRSSKQNVARKSRRFIVRRLCDIRFVISKFYGW